jgi:hypothetical protein
MSIENQLIVYYSFRPIHISVAKSGDVVANYSD